MIVIYCMNTDQVEKKLLSIFNRIKNWTPDSNGYIYDIFKRKMIQVHHVDKRLYLSYHQIWEILKKEFNLKHIEIESITKDVIEKYAPPELPIYETMWFNIGNRLN